jgi:hypothetical protein
MPIRVTCTKCMSRFDVSEKFAGREGPCPKCKTVIRIPEANEQVVVHAPETSGPSDGKGRPVLKPIRRKETVLTPVQIVVISFVIVGFLVGSLLLREFYPEAKSIPVWLIPAILTALAPACVLGAYTFLRDQEMGSFAGRQLWVRIAICAAIYAALWATMLGGWFAFRDWGPAAWLSSSVVMLAIGAAAATLVLDLDWLMGLVHYGLYFGCSLLLRLVAGVGVFPGQLEMETTPAVPPLNPAGGAPLGWIDTATSALGWWLGGG